MKPATKAAKLQLSPPYPGRKRKKKKYLPDFGLLSNRQLSQIGHLLVGLYLTILADAAHCTR